MGSALNEVRTLVECREERVNEGERREGREGRANSGYPPYRNIERQSARMQPCAGMPVCSYVRMFVCPRWSTVHSLHTRNRVHTSTLWKHTDTDYSPLMRLDRVEYRISRHLTAEARETPPARMIPRRPNPELEVQSIPEPGAQVEPTRFLFLLSSPLSLQAATCMSISISVGRSLGRRDYSTAKARETGFSCSSCTAL